jgi:hypothetical protein
MVFLNVNWMTVRRRGKLIILFFSDHPFSPTMPWIDTGLGYYEPL